MTPSFDPARLAELPADLRAELRALFEAQRADVRRPNGIRADQRTRRTPSHRERTGCVEGARRAPSVAREGIRARAVRQALGEVRSRPVATRPGRYRDRDRRSRKNARKIARAAPDARRQAKEPAAPPAPFRPICRASSRSSSLRASRVRADAARWFGSARTAPAAST